MAMIPIIANDELTRIGMIDDYISFIWAARYYDIGDFELVARIEHISMLHIGYYVIRDDDTDVGIIEKISIEAREDGEEVIIASGRFLTSILARRVIAGQRYYNNSPVESIINSLIMRELGSLATDERMMSNVSFTSEVSCDSIAMQVTGTNLWTKISELCKTYGLGMKGSLSGTDFVFTLYQGLDRTYGQTVNQPAIFSDKYESLASSEYEEDHSIMITDVLVAGEGEGSDRRMTWASDGSGATGLDRYEAFKDARNIQSNNGAISDEDYLAQLEEAGTELLTKYTQAFSGQVNFDTVVYKTDVSLGDLCVIENERWGVSTNARLVEVIESTDESGMYTLTPTFVLE